MRAIPCGPMATDDKHASPAAQACRWCGEGGALFHGMHWECGLRSVMGSVRCQQGLCARHGGPGCGDDPELTRREAAQQAAAFWWRTCVCRLHPELCPVHHG